MPRATRRQQRKKRRNSQRTGQSEWLLDPQSTVEEDKAALHLLNPGPLGSSSLKPPRRSLQSKPNYTRTAACAVFGDTIKRCHCGPRSLRDVYERIGPGDCHHMPGHMAKHCGSRKRVQGSVSGADGDDEVSLLKQSRPKISIECSVVGCRVCLGDKSNFKRNFATSSGSL